MRERLVALRGGLSLILWSMVIFSFASAGGLSFGEVSGPANTGVPVAYCALRPLGSEVSWGRISAWENGEASRDQDVSLRVWVAGLDPLGVFDLEIGLDTVGSFRADHLGRAEFLLTSDSALGSGRTEYTDFRSNPVIVRDSDGAGVLEGKFRLVNQNQGPPISEMVATIASAGLPPVLGIATLQSYASGGCSFLTRATNLEPESSWTIRVDGMVTGIAVADHEGQAALSLSSDSPGGLPPLGLCHNEAARRIEWIDARSGLVLSGYFADVVRRSLDPGIRGLDGVELDSLGQDVPTIIDRMLRVTETRNQSPGKTAPALIFSNGFEDFPGGWVPLNESPVLPLGPTGNWELVLSEEFDSSQLDNSVWSPQYEWSPYVINNELQFYNPVPGENVRLENGRLLLIADNTPRNGQDYSSGCISSHNKFAFKYGVLEARVKVPAGKGLWPAVWMMPFDSSWPPEIDLMETKGSNPTEVFLSYHYKKDDNYRFHGDAYEGPNFSNGFHVFTLEWTTNRLRWYVDGQLRGEFSDSAQIPHMEMYILLNLAVGGPFDGPPDQTTTFPAQYTIDYVRVWQ